MVAAVADSSWPAVNDAPDPFNGAAVPGAHGAALPDVLMSFHSREQLPQVLRFLFGLVADGAAQLPIVQGVCSAVVPPEDSGFQPWLQFRLEVLEGMADADIAALQHLETPGQPWFLLFSFFCFVFHLFSHLLGGRPRLDAPYP